MDLTLFEPIGSIAPPPAEPVALPGIGACATQPDTEGRPWIITRRAANIPIPASAGFNAIEKYISPASFESREELSRLKLVLERPIATTRRDFDFRGI